MVMVYGSSGKQSTVYILSDSQLAWWCSCVTGQDAPCWKCQRFALTKPKPYTSTKTSHMIVPFPHTHKKKLTFRFAVKGATGFRAAAPLTLVNIWYDGMGEQRRENKETFPIFFFKMHCPSISLINICASLNKINVSLAVNWNLGITALAELTY